MKIITLLLLMKMQNLEAFLHQEEIKVLEKTLTIPNLMGNLCTKRCRSIMVMELMEKSWKKKFETTSFCRIRVFI